MIYEESRIICLKRLKIKKKEERIMKNIFKYLGIFAIAGTIGFQTTNAVQVSECKDGQVIHTNYYMFLESDNRDSLQASIDAATGESYGIFTAADKFNNIKLADYLSDGSIEIGTTNDPDNMKWSIAEYWRRYYSGLTTNYNSQTGVSDNGTEHYLFHDKWYKYQNENFTDTPEIKTNQGSGVHDELLNQIKLNWNNLDSQPLVKTGTYLPKTLVTIPSNLYTSQTETTHHWTIKRLITKGTQLPSGVPLKDKRIVYAPHVFYVKYCGNPVEDTSKKTITYDKNATDKVEGMPTNQEFGDKCVTLTKDVRPTRVGYEFIGWAKDSKSTTTDYVPGSEYCGDSVTLYAVWVPENKGPYTITYHAKGGKDEPKAESAEAGVCLNISKQKPTLQGNTFLGWSTDPKAVEPEKVYDPGEEYCGTRGDLDLYAVWRTDTGLSGHLLVFASIALVAGTAFIIAKKKNLFKQI